MDDAILVYIGAAISSIRAGSWPAETTNGLNYSNTKTVQPLAFYTPGETKFLEDYYGAPLAFLAGIEFMCNAEYPLFLAELTETL